MFRQRFFHRYPRLVFGSLAVLTFGLISLGILTLSARYPF